MFASTSAKPDRDGTKDSVAQIREAGVFCVNIVEYAARDAMNATSGAHPAGTDEFAVAGVAKAECDTIDCPRVRGGARPRWNVSLTQIVALPGEANFAVFGEVTGVHMRDDCLRGRQVRRDAVQPARPAGLPRLHRRARGVQLARPDD